MSTDSKRSRAYRDDHDGKAGTWKRRTDPSTDVCTWQSEAPCPACAFLRNRIVELEKERDSERRHLAWTEAQLKHQGYVTEGEAYDNARQAASVLFGTQEADRLFPVDEKP